MRIIKNTNWIPGLLLIGLFFVNSPLQAQRTKLIGEQTKQQDTAKAELKCIPVKITKTMRIDKVTGNNAGFWIQKESETIYKFGDMKEAVGIILGPGTYYVYPNIAPNQHKAKVEVTLL
ncbi:MAG: hypothetical protein WC341_11880 [Bacteroidales bacterium]|jgi:hypothetical protein